MKLEIQMALAVAAAMLSASQEAKAQPPFNGTIFIDPDIITPSDPSSFQGIAPAGWGWRWMFDRRVNHRVYLYAFLFDASYDDGLDIEIQVNPEFGDSTVALEEAQKYAEVIGRLPRALRADVETVWIHLGTRPFGGGNHNLLIHTGQADRYTASGILEETLAHEACHTSLDAAHARAPGWRAAQAADEEYISKYAREFPHREDIAESFLPYLAVRHRAGRISPSLAGTICRTLPNRIAYFDRQAFEMHPIAIAAPKLSATRTGPNALLISWPSPSTGWRLQESTTLTGSVWSTPPEAIEDNGTTKSITVNIATNSRFFRLAN